MDTRIKQLSDRVRRIDALLQPVRDRLSLDWDKWNEEHRGEGGGRAASSGRVTMSGSRATFKVGTRNVTADLDPSDLDNPDRHAELASGLKDDLRDAGHKISSGEAKAIVKDAYEARALADPVKSVPVLAGRVFGKKGVAAADGTVSWSKKGGNDDKMREIASSLKAQGFKREGEPALSNANNAEYAVEQWSHPSGAKAVTQSKTSYVGQGANSYFAKIKPGR